MGEFSEYRDEVITFSVTFVFCFAVQLLSPVILPRLSSWYSNLYFKLCPDEKKWEWNNRVMCVIHSVVLTIMSFYFYFKHPEFYVENDPSFFSKGVSIMVAFSGAYFTYDSILIAFDPKQYTTNTVYIFHHFISVVAMAYILSCRKFHIGVLYGGMSEVSIPSIHLLHFQRISGLTKNKLYVYNKVFLWLTWGFFRCVMGTSYFAVYIYGIKNRNQFIEHEGMGGFVFWSIFLVLLSAMNLLWMWKITLRMLGISSKKQQQKEKEKNEEGGEEKED